MMRTRGSLVAIAAAMALLVAACGGGGSDGAADDSGDGSSGEGAVSSVDDAKGAVVQVVSEGEFRDPEVGTVSSAGSGSGFIIDPEGIVVTNNHVVTGAGSVKVMVGGADDEIPAKVVGVSECNDLAVLKLDDPGPYPYFNWAAEVPKPALDVYALGFPLGDPEYTATKGVVSKAAADGDTSWASVRSVIEHDANIQPGNSGGPLVSKNGKVVGVNYASYANDQTTTQQFYAINSKLAGNVINTLRKGDELSIGVNGTAVADEESGIAGVWVNGVSAGGPAKKAGIAPGDVITNLNGVELDSGTMEEYCDVLRSASDGEALSVRVLRFDTSEQLEGEIYGDPLSTSYSFASELADDVASGDEGDAVTTDQYVEVTDATKRIKTSVPGQWSDVNPASQDLLGLGSPQPTLMAAPDLAAFDNSKGPGVGVVVVEGFSAAGVTPETVLDAAVKGSGCTESARDTYDDGKLAGPYAVTDCGGVTGVILTAVSTANPDVLVLVIGLAATDNDLAVMDQVLTDLTVS